MYPRGATIKPTLQSKVIKVEDKNESSSGRKQSVVASSVEVEFRSMAQGICEGMWLRRLLSELKISVDKSMKMFCDN